MRGLALFCCYFIEFTFSFGQKPGVYLRDLPSGVIKSTTYDELTIKKDSGIEYRHYECFGAFFHKGKYFIKNSEMYIVTNDWPINANFRKVRVKDSFIMVELKLISSAYNVPLDSCKLVIGGDYFTDTFITNKQGSTQFKISLLDSHKFSVEILDINYSSINISGSKHAHNWFSFGSQSQNFDTLHFSTVKSIGNRKMIFKTAKGEKAVFRRKKGKSFIAKLTGVFRRKERQ